MAKKGKKFQEAAKQVDSLKAYAPKEALELVKKIDFAKFDATVEVVYKLNVDTKQADNYVVPLFYQTVLVKNKP